MNHSLNHSLDSLGALGRSLAGASAPLVGDAAPDPNVMTLFGSAMSGGGQPQFGRPDGDLDPESEGHVAHDGRPLSTEAAVARALHRPVHLAHPVHAPASDLFPTAEV